MKPVNLAAKNSENKLKLTLFVLLMTKFVNKRTDNTQKHLTLPLKNKGNLGLMGKVRACTPRSSGCLRRNASCWQVLQHASEALD